MEFTKIGFRSGYHYGFIHNCDMTNISKVSNSIELDQTESDQIVDNTQKLIKTRLLNGDRFIVVKSENICQVMNVPLSTKFSVHEYTNIKSISFFIYENPHKDLSKKDNLIANLPQNLPVELVIWQFFGDIDLIFQCISECNVKSVTLRLDRTDLSFID